MKTVKIAELKNRLSEHLRAVERGSEVVVLDRDRPIARIVPVAEGPRRLAIHAPARPFKDVVNRRYRPVKLAVTSGELLSQERGDR